MTEKEFRKLVSDVEVSRDKKEQIQTMIDSLNQKLTHAFKHFDIVSFRRGGSLNKQTMLNTSKEYDIIMTVKPKINKIFSLTNKVVLYETIASLISEEKAITKLSDITSFEEKNEITIKLNDEIINIYVFYDVLLVDMPVHFFSDVEEKREKFVDLANKEYTYFKNTIQIIKFYRDEKKLQGITGLMIEVILYYALKEYCFDIRYEDYINAFLKGLDDFIMGKKIEINDSMYEALETSKKEIIKRPFTIIDVGCPSLNLAEEVTEIKIGEFRKLRKTLGKLVETKSLKDLSTGVVKLNVNPLQNNDGTISWSFKIEDTKFLGSGGNYPNTKEDILTAIYKGLLKGLKAVIDNNLNRKQVEIICNDSNILNTSTTLSNENSARRKNVLAYIDNNQIKITNK